MVRMGSVSIGDIKDIYSGANSWKSVFDHVTGAGDSPVWSMAGLGSDVIGIGQGVASAGAKALGRADIVKAAATPVIEAGLLTLMGMSNTLGFGEPESGERFGDGANAFNDVGETLASTRSPDSWEGDASSNYSQKNSDHQKRAQDLAAQDAVIKQALDEQRVNVTDTRNFIDHRATILTAAIVPAILAMEIEFPPGSGLLLSLEIQWAAFAATVPFCSERYGEMAGHAIVHAQTIQKAGAEYARIAQQASSALA